MSRMMTTIGFVYADGRSPGKYREAIFAGHFRKGDRTGNGKGTFRSDGFCAYETEGPEQKTKKHYHLHKTADMKVVKEIASDKADDKPEPEEDKKEDEEQKKLEGEKQTEGGEADNQPQPEEDKN